jgi:hypothetical protein
MTSLIIAILIKIGIFNANTNWNDLSPKQQQDYKKEIIIVDIIQM